MTFFVHTKQLMDKVKFHRHMYREYNKLKQKETRISVIKNEERELNSECFFLNQIRITNHSVMNNLDEINPFE